MQTARSTGSDTAMRVAQRILILSMALGIAAAAIIACGRGPAPLVLNLGDDPGDRAAPPQLGAFPPARVSFVIYDLDRRAVVRSFNRRVPHIPASTTKVLTVVAARDILGPDHRWETILARTGGIDGAVLTGDLFLKGTGDPLLTAADLMAMADQLHTTGVRRITGRFVYDEDTLAARGRIDPSMDQDYAYNAGVSALSVDCNTVFAVWKKEGGRGPFRPWLVPSLAVNGVALGSAGDRDSPRFAYTGTGEREAWLLNPVIDRTGRERLPVKDPGRFTAHLFARLCAIRGITLPTPTKGTLPGGHRVVARNTGRSLDDLAEITLTYSNNVMAELLALGAARALREGQGPPDRAMAAMTAWLKDHVRGIDWTGFLLVNGSGLTGGNRISAEQMLGVLVYADRRDDGPPRFMTLLPSSGWKWSLLTRLNTPQTAFRVWAKTGTINYATALAGYLFTDRGRRMAFAITISDPEQRARFEASPARRTRAGGAAAERWVKESRELVDAIVTSWIREL